MIYELQNEKIRIKVNEQGAELISLVRKDNGYEYIWDGSAYWKRHSPILFPIVGNVAGKKYRINDKEYEMSQHGFARDMMFDYEGKDGNTIWFELNETKETLKIYPYYFQLRIGYELSDDELHVKWEVKNNSYDDMYFMIGAHPAFMCPPDRSGKNGCSIDFHTDKPIKCSMLKDGLVGKKNVPCAAEDGRLLIDGNTFDNDALIFEHDLTHQLSLISRENKEFLRIEFPEHVFGIWAPAGDEVPFVCLEPWDGRTDPAGFNGDISEREYELHLRGHEVFKTEYNIACLDF